MIDGPEVLRFVAAFAVIGLVLFAFTMLSRQGARAGSFLRRDRLIEVIETTPLARTSSLHVVKIGESYLVIGRTEGGMSVLKEIPDEVVARRTAGAPSWPLRFLAPRPR